MNPDSMLPKKPLPPVPQQKPKKPLPPLPVQETVPPAPVQESPVRPKLLKVKIMSRPSPPPAQFSLTNKYTAVLSAMCALMDPENRLVPRAKIVAAAPALIYARAPSSYGGATRSQSLSRDLQKLRDHGDIEFYARGIYRVTEQAVAQYSGK